MAMQTCRQHHTCNRTGLETTTLKLGRQPLFCRPLRRDSTPGLSGKLAQNSAGQIYPTKDTLFTQRYIDLTEEKDIAEARRKAARARLACLRGKNIYLCLKDSQQDQQSFTKQAQNLDEDDETARGQQDISANLEGQAKAYYEPTSSLKADVGRLQSEVCKLSEIIFKEQAALDQGSCKAQSGSNKGEKVLTSADTPSKDAISPEGPGESKEACKHPAIAAESVCSSKPSSSEEDLPQWWQKGACYLKEQTEANWGRAVTATNQTSEKAASNFPNNLQDLGITFRRNVDKAFAALSFAREAALGGCVCEVPANIASCQLLEMLHHFTEACVLTLISGRPLKQIVPNLCLLSKSEVHRRSHPLDAGLRPEHALAAVKPKWCSFGGETMMSSGRAAGSFAQAGIPGVQH
ncbi:hypothetical protein WJX73_003931 [Symbiochloris irregularis]|uniref:Uncharacterized protein n=1 Tax=Symbiochloris irregularis TaxID=706552 RepID=A0AAW1PD59_9CHLO